MASMVFTIPSKVWKAPVDLRRTQNVCTNVSRVSSLTAINNKCFSNFAVDIAMVRNVQPLKEVGYCNLNILDLQPWQKVMLNLDIKEKRGHLFHHPPQKDAFFFLHCFHPFHPPESLPLGLLGIIHHGRMFPRQRPLELTLRLLGLRQCQPGLFIAQIEDTQLAVLSLSPQKRAKGTRRSGENMVKMVKTIAKLWTPIGSYGLEPHLLIILPIKLKWGVDSTNCQLGHGMNLSLRLNLRTFETGTSSSPNPRDTKTQVMMHISNPTVL